MICLVFQQPKPFRAERLETVEKAGWTACRKNFEKQTAIFLKQKSILHSKENLAVYQRVRLYNLLQAHLF